MQRVYWGTEEERQWEEDEENWNQEEEFCPEEECVQYGEEEESEWYEYEDYDIDHEYWEENGQVDEEPKTEDAVEADAPVGQETENDEHNALLMMLDSL